MRCIQYPIALEAPGYYVESMSQRSPSELFCALDIVERIAQIEGVAARQLPPLYDSIDPELVDALVRTTPSEFELTFTYAGYDVRVTPNEYHILSDDTIEVVGSVG